jgi:hypothetical protein
MKPPREYNGEEPSPEPWITKQHLAEHLSVTTRWIELQQRRGLPHIHTPGMNRYRIFGSRGLATQAVRLAARPVDDFCRAAPRAPPRLSISPLFATIRRPTANRGDWWCLALTLAIIGVPWAVS